MRMLRQRSVPARVWFGGIPDFRSKSSQTGKRGRFKCSPADSELSNPQSLTTKGRGEVLRLGFKKSQKETEKTEKFNSEL
jgi:hypothetical protein